MLFPFLLDRFRDTGSELLNQHAIELLDDRRGALVPFQNPDAIAQKSVELLDTPALRHSMRKRGYLFAREMVWKRVAQGYMESFSRVRSDRLQTPRVQFSARVAPKSLNQLPVLKLNHLHRLTDDIGMFQHSIFTVPNYGEGYTTDDNARALVFTASLARTMSDNPSNRKSASSASSLEASSRYLSFLEHSFNPANGRFKNFLAFDRRWNETEGSEDSHVRRTV